MDNPQPTCRHLHRAWTSTGGNHYYGGSVYDDILEVELCMDCGAILDDNMQHSAFGDDDVPDIGDLASQV